jgi:hypothetical protein
VNARSVDLPHKTRLLCPCGEFLQAADAEGLVRMAQAHLAAEHPHLASAYDQEDILWMAY